MNNTDGEREREREREREVYVHVCMCTRREGTHVYVHVCSGHYNNVGASVYVQYICHVALSLSHPAVVCLLEGGFLIGGDKSSLSSWNCSAAQRYTLAKLKQSKYI